MTEAEVKRTPRSSVVTIKYSWKMFDINIDKRETQMTDLSVMIDRCSLDSQYDRLPANVGCSNISYADNDYCYNTSDFLSNDTFIGQKRMEKKI